jgi:hypothetical protein
MFGLNPFILYGAIAAVVISFSSGATIGYKWEKSNFDNYKLEQERNTRIKEQEHQAVTDEIRKTKDAKIADINNKLVDAISELRKRTSRPAEVPNNGQSCSGRNLYSEDAIFLTREAARADIIRTALEACYNQYDKITDVK